MPGWTGSWEGQTVINWLSEDLFFDRIKKSRKVPVYKELYIRKRIVGRQAS